MAEEANSDGALTILKLLVEMIDNDAVGVRASDGRPYWRGYMLPRSEIRLIQLARAIIERSRSA